MSDWKLEIEEFEFAGCMHNHSGMNTVGKIVDKCEKREYEKKDQKK